jgi:general bacterial porin, GBP family
MKLRHHTLTAAGLLAIAASTAQAQSSITVYGIAAVEAVHATGVNTGTATGTQTRLDNSQVTSSRLGFRGTEDLGGGLSAVFDMTSGIALDTGAQANAGKFWNRGSWVGLKSSTFGTLSFGRHWNVNDDVMGNYFIFGGYAAFRFTEFGFISDLVDNSVKYVSPKLGGFVLRGLVGAGEGTTGRTGEVALTYGAGPFSAVVSYRNARNVADTAADELTTAGVSFAIDTVRLHGGISLADPKASALREARAYDVGVVWTATPTLIATLDYVARDQSDTDNDSSFWRVGADYYLSKRTSLFANLVALDNKGTASQRFYGLGAAGLDQDVFALGLRHTF